MKVAGFFSGVGGIELGFTQAGFDVTWSNEIDVKLAKLLSSLIQTSLPGNWRS